MDFIVYAFIPFIYLLALPYRLPWSCEWECRKKFGKCFPSSNGPKIVYWWTHFIVSNRIIKFTIHGSVEIDPSHRLMTLFLTLVEDLCLLTIGPNCRQHLMCSMDWRDICKKTIEQTKWKWLRFMLYNAHSKWSGLKIHPRVNFWP